MAQSALSSYHCSPPAPMNPLLALPILSSWTALAGIPPHVSRGTKVLAFLLVMLEGVTKFISNLALTGTYTDRGVFNHDRRVPWSWKVPVEHLWRKHCSTAIDLVSVDFDDARGTGHPVQAARCSKEAQGSYCAPSAKSEKEFAWGDVQTPNPRLTNSLF